MAGPSLQNTSSFQTSTAAWVSSSPPDTVLSDQEFLLHSLELVHKLVRCLCHRQGISPDEREELEGEVRVKLMENDYRVLRQCDDPARLPSYLGLVVISTWHDRLRKLKGRAKRPSSRARVLGPAAIELEKHLGRGETVDVAYERLKHDFPELGCKDFEDLAEKVKPRPGRRMEGDETLAVLASPEPGGDQRLERREGQARKRRALALMAKHLAELPEEDRRLLVRACAGGVKVSRIARSLGLEQKPLYRRIDKRLSDLRHKLEEAGICWKDLRDVLGIDDSD